jgi:hypothetical protein
MKKSIPLLALLSFPALAADLTKDGVYYCTEETAIVLEYEAKIAKPHRFTLTYKDNVLTMKSPKYDDVVWVHDPMIEGRPVTIIAHEMFLSAFKYDAIIKMQEGASDTVQFSHYRSDGSPRYGSQMMTRGTCEAF